MNIEAEVSIIPQQIKAPSDIYVENFIKALYGLFTNTNVSVIKPNGTEDTFYAYEYWKCYYEYSRDAYLKYSVFYANAGEGDDTFGIIVGASTEEEKMDNYNLIAKYPHGTDVNQVYYGSSTIEDLGYDEENKRHVIRVRRWFENRGTSDIVINEVGLIVKNYVYMRDAHCGLHIDKGITFLITRTVLPTSFTLPVGRMCEVNQYIYLYF